MEKIIQNFDLLTTAEKRVCNYIVNNYKKVINMNINDLAKDTFTSKTVVINMAKKLNFEGFSHLKYHLKSIDKSNKEKKKELDVFHLVDMSKKLVNKDMLHKAVNMILKCKTVYVSGRGTSKTCAMYLNRLLLILGIKCILIDDYNLLSVAANNVEPRELFVLISLSGETNKIIECAKIVKSRQAKLISITSFSHNTLSKLSDISLFVACDSADTLKDDDKSRIGVFITIELLINELKNKLT